MLWQLRISIDAACADIAWSSMCCMRFYGGRGVSVLESASMTPGGSASNSKFACVFGLQISVYVLHAE